MVSGRAKSRCVWTSQRHGIQQCGPKRMCRPAKSCSVSQSRAEANCMRYPRGPTGQHAKGKEEYGDTQSRAPDRNHPLPVLAKGLAPATHVPHGADEECEVCGRVLKTKLPHCATCFRHSRRRAELHEGHKGTTTHVLALRRGPEPKATSTSAERKRSMTTTTMSSAKSAWSSSLVSIPDRTAITGAVHNEKTTGLRGQPCFTSLQTGRSASAFQGNQCWVSSYNALIARAGGHSHA